MDDLGEDAPPFQGDLGQIILDSLSSRIVIVDRRGIIVAANSQAGNQLTDSRGGLCLAVGDDLGRQLRRFGATGHSAALSVADGLCAVLDERRDRWMDDRLGPIGAGQWYSVEIVGIAGGGAVVSMSDITERVAAERERLHQSTHDPLTGLPNRAFLVELLAQALGESRRRPSLAVLMVDLDWFNVVNASVGHHMGDQLIAVIAERLVGLAGDATTVARVAGDRFVVVLPTVRSDQEVVALAEEIGRCVAQPIALSAKRQVQLTASVGIVVAHSSHRRPDDLLRDADAAVHRAKELGRARYEVADRELRRRLRERLETEQDLRRAIERGELRIDFQPEVSLLTGDVLGAEALVRWQHSERGTLLPGEFIHLAEETGLIVAIGEWVLREACREAASWPLPLFVAVNLSARQLTDPGLIDAVASALADSGLEPKRLCLEITESAVVESFETAAAVVTALRDTGVLVALDDFGTGHSSLSYLCRLPVDTVKIDRSFVQRVGSGATERTIVEAIVRLAHALGLQVVAEGVEDGDQSRLLVDLGCSVGQGFELGRPGAASAVIGQALRVGAL